MVVADDAAAEHCLLSCLQIGPIPGFQDVLITIDEQQLLEAFPKFKGDRDRIVGRFVRQYDSKSASTRQPTTRDVGDAFDDVV